MRPEEVAPGVVASIAEDGDVAVGNAGFVDLGGEAFVFDTHVSLAAPGRARSEDVVPGHGRVSGPELIDFVHGYLDAFNHAKPGDANPYPELPWPEMWERNLGAFADRSA